MDDGEYEEILEDMREECQKFGMHKLSFSISYFFLVILHVFWRLETHFLTVAVVNWLTRVIEIEKCFMLPVQLID